MRTLMFFVFCNLITLSYGQDYIHKQYVDPIYGKVLDISEKEITYRKHTYFDSSECVIKKREVIEIEYEDGSIQPISKSRWDKFYRPSVYFIWGEYFSSLGSSNDESVEYGIGHKGVFRLPWKGFGISYTVDFRFGNYANKDSLSGINSQYKKYVSGSLNVGIEYRYSFFRGLGFYAGAETGYYILSFFDQNLVYSSPVPNYNLYLGAHAWRIEFGLKYTGGVISRKTTHSTQSDYYPYGDRYNLSIIQLYWGFNF